MFTILIFTKAAKMKLKSTIKYYYILLVLFILLPKAYAQVGTRQPDSHIATANQMNDLFNIAGNKTMDYSDIEGSPYYINKYASTSLKNHAGKIIGEYPLKYNAFRDEMETPMANGEIGELSKVEFISLFLNNEKYIVQNFVNSDGKTTKGYFIEIETGKNCSIYSRKLKILQQAEEAKSTFHPPTPAKFLEQNNIYVKFNEKTPKKIRLNRKKVLDSFENHNKALKEFTKTEKLNLNKLDGLISLVRYYNNIE